MNNLFFSVLVLASWFAQNVAAQPSSTMLQNFKECRQYWEKVRDAHNNTYMYTLDILPGEGDFHHELDVYIENGKVAKTNYRFYKSQKVTRKDSKLRKEFNGYKVTTIDEMFPLCEKEFFTKDSLQNHILFFTNQDKLPQTFAYYPRNLADAPLFGYSIRKIEMKQQSVKDISIIGTWTLLSSCDIRTLKQSKYARSNGSAFSVSFGDAGNISYPMDVNNCTDNYTLLPNKGIKIGTEGRGSICTKKCCDEVSPPFLGASKYAFRKEQLVLIDGTMEYIFEKSK